MSNDNAESEDETEGMRPLEGIASALVGRY
jgi:hypothetical protein